MVQLLPPMYCRRLQLVALVALCQFLTRVLPKLPQTALIDEPLNALLPVLQYVLLDLYRKTYR
jgi:hypothetical protein